MLQAAGRMRGLVLEIEVDILETWQFELNQMRVGRPIEIRLDPPNRLTHPIPVACIERPIDSRLV